MCTCAPACKALVSQLNALYPTRSKASDGCCASPQHSKQNPTSDHERGDAQDITHDPAHGVDAHAIAERLKQSGDDRIRYVISNSRIWNPSVSPNWRKYTGSNPHTKHCHVSIRSDRRNDTSPWPLTESGFTMDDEAKAAFAALSGRLDVIADVVGKTAGEIAVLRSAIKGVADDANGMSWLGERVAEIKADLDAVKEAHGITD